MKDNKLIAEFMGWKMTGPGFPSGYENPHNTYCHVEDLEFHSSWDWLMPVVQKISEKYSFYLSNDSGEWQVLIDISNTDVVSKSLHTAVYQAVLEFIKWYNENEYT